MSTFPLKWSCFTVRIQLKRFTGSSKVNFVIMHLEFISIINYLSYYFQLAKLADISP
jgi:hypothetical protein